MILITVAIILSIYLMVAAVWDLRTLRTPTWLTVPAVAAVLVWQTWQFDMAFLPFWFGCLVARYKRVHALPLLFRWVKHQLTELSFLRPSKAELEWAGEPFTIFISMAGLIYIWIFAMGLGG